MHDRRGIHQAIVQEELARLANLPRRHIDQVIAVSPAKLPILAAHLLPVALAGEDVHLLPGLQAANDVVGFDGR